MLVSQTSSQVMAAIVWSHTPFKRSRHLWTLPSSALKDVADTRCSDKQQHEKRGAGGEIERGGGGVAAPRLQHAGQRRGEGRPIPQLLLNERPHPVQELLCSPATPPSVRCTLIHFNRLTALAVATKHCSTASPSIGAGMPTGTGAPPGVPCVLEELQELRATGKGHPKYEKAAAAGFRPVILLDGAFITHAMRNLVACRTEGGQAPDPPAR